MTSHPLTIIGWCEWVTLPELGMGCIRAKMDTGAKVSALHAYNLEFFRDKGQQRVRFQIHPPSSDLHQKTYDFEVADERFIMDTSGRRERRTIIDLKVELGPWNWVAEISLTDRGHLQFPLLLGRRALRRRFAIDSSKKYTFPNESKTCL